MLRFGALLLGALLLGACRDAPETGPATAPPPPTSQPPRGAAEPARPDTLRDTLRIEGRPEPFTFVRFDEPDVPFTTYRPEDLVPELTTSDDGSSVRFYAAFGGTRRDDTYLGFFFPAAEGPLTSVDALQTFLEGPDGYFAQNGWTATGGRPDEGNTPCDWAVAAYRIEDAAAGSDANGALCIGVHDGAPFFVTEHVPNALAEGFGPRASRLLDAFRWRDDGTRLGGSRPSSSDPF